jgi:hypothetical protein
MTVVRNLKLNFPSLNGYRIIDNIAEIVGRSYVVVN